MSDVKILTQFAPWPVELEMLVAELVYDEHFIVTLHPHMDRDYAPDDHYHKGPCLSGGTTLEILLVGVEDTYHSGVKRPPTSFYFPVPPATFNRDSWNLWLLDCIGLVELHERIERYRLVRTIVDDGDHRPHVERPFAPLHGPGDDPNRVHIWIENLPERRRMDFRGRVKEEADA